MLQNENLSIPPPKNVNFDSIYPFLLEFWFIPCYIVPTATNGGTGSAKSNSAADSSKVNAEIQNLEQAASMTQSTLVTDQGRQLHRQHPD